MFYFIIKASNKERGSKMKEFEKIIGYTAIKNELTQIADVLKNRKVYEDLGIQMPGGILLYGEPGVGKSLMASCFIKASGLTSYVCRKDQPNGDFVKHIKETFEEAAKKAPSIVFLDDMDKFTNSDEERRDSEEYVTVQSCIDEVKGQNVFVLATVNNINKLPRSLTRPGRFDRLIEILPPTGKEAEKIIEYYLKNKKMKLDIDLKSISKILNGSSCADLEAVINLAGIFAGFQREQCITTEHMLEACMRIIYKALPPEEEKEDYLKNLEDGTNLFSRVIYHESGHALIAELLHPGIVSFITIHSRRRDSKGFVTYYNDSTIESLKYAKIRILAGLGGMAALDSKFGIIDSGAKADFDQVFRYMIDLIREDCLFGLHNHYNPTIDTAEKENAVEQLATSQIYFYYQKVKEMITVNHTFLEKMAHQLAKKGMLCTKDIEEIKKTCPLVPIDFL